MVAPEVRGTGCSRAVDRDLAPVTRVAPEVVTRVDASPLRRDYLARDSLLARDAALASPVRAGLLARDPLLASPVRGAGLSPSWRSRYGLGLGYSGYRSRFADRYRL